jgi:hypothetical protein
MKHWLCPSTWKATNPKTALIFKKKGAGRGRDDTANQMGISIDAIALRECFSCIIDEVKHDQNARFD